ncbi:MAG: polyprenyl synthetase family protein [Gammaproteobacteria bacterium]
MSIASTIDNPSATTATLQSIHQLVKADFEGVNAILSQQLQSDINLISQIAVHILHSGGKRLRPLLVLLTAKTLGYKGQNHYLLAAIIELIHTATLLHDDVVDRAHLRRGHSTANAIWGDQASVLVGDFLYSRTFQMMAELNCMRVMSVFAEATNTIASGEVMQLTNCRRAETSVEEYLEVIHRKTAKLFEAATQLGAIVAQATHAQELAFARYGLHLGIAFQLIDDVLDYCAPIETLGKTVGNDLAEGKPTLPLLFALQKGNLKQMTFLKKVIVQGSTDDFATVLEIIKTTHALKHTRQLAKQHQELATQALTEIPDSEYRNALLTLCSFAINRDH